MTTAAERMREYRRRKRNGAAVSQSIEWPAKVVDHLIDLGMIGDDWRDTGEDIGPAALILFGVFIDRELAAQTAHLYRPRYAVTATSESGDTHEPKIKRAASGRCF